MDFRRDLRIISAFSVLLVIGSAVVIGYVMSRLIPDIDLATGIALGAIISPTDAVATSIVKRAGVAPRLVTVLEGESLLNDASALVLLRSATAATALLTGSVAADFVWAVVVAVIIGLVIGRLNLVVRAHIHLPTSNVAISLVVPFFAYIPAERLDASGLVAAVVAGLVTGHGAPKYLRPQDRMTADAVWRTLEMLLESAIFLLMGLELYGLIVEVHDAHDSVWTAIRLGLLAAVLVIIVRAVFVAPSLWLLARRGRRGTAIRDKITSFQDQLQDGSLAPRVGRPRRRSEDELDQHRVDRTARISTSLTRRLADIDYLAAQAFGWREGVVLVWAGMRGAVTLAAAQSLPADTPQRSLLVLIAFVVAAGTLMVQGSTLGWLVRLLGLTGRDADADLAAAQELRSVLLSEVSDRLARDELTKVNGRPSPRPPWTGVARSSRRSASIPRSGRPRVRTCAPSAVSCGWPSSSCSARSCSRSATSGPTRRPCWRRCSPSWTPTSSAWSCGRPAERRVARSVAREHPAQQVQIGGTGDLDPGRGPIGRQSSGDQPEPGLRRQPQRPVARPGHVVQQHLHLLRQPQGELRLRLAGGDAAGPATDRRAPRSCRANRSGSVRR